MLKFLTAFTAIVLLAGYAVQPLEKTVPYKVTVARGESVWDVCAKVASSRDDVQEVVYNTLKENHISNPGSVQPGTELIIRVKEMK
nr:MAG TPA: cell division suppressor protein [Caudoviricetes sp.]